MQLRRVERRPLQPRIIERRALQPRTSERRAFQLCRIEPGALQLRRVEQRPLQLCRDERRALQSRCTDDTGYVQPANEALIAARGMNSDYHNNAIKSWKIGPDGSVENVNA